MSKDDIARRRENTIDTQMSTSIGREFVSMILDDNCWGLDPFAPELTSMSYNVARIQTANALYGMVEGRQPEQTAMMLVERRERRDRVDEGLNDD